MPSSSKRLIRMNLGLHPELEEMLKEAAEERYMSTSDLIREFIVIGFKLMKLQETPGVVLVVKEDGKERPLPLL